ncbi:MAG: hypothetical protein IJO20_04340 [Ruminococcus sp.]|nr:hypothetical protein [Ruminococcus sp.]
MSHNKKLTKAQIKAQIKEKKRMKALALQRNITVFALLVLLILGLVSTTFSAFVSDNTGESGSLVADIQTVAVKQNNKNDLADTKANVDVTTTAATRTYVAGEYIYIENFKPSGWGDCWVTSTGKAYLYIWNSGSSGTWYPFELYSGTAGAVGAIYRAKVTTAGTYSHFITTRGDSNYASGWSGSTGFWNQTGDLELSSSSNCYYGFTAGGTSRNSKIYAVPPSSVTASVTNAVSGTGTNSNPYIVRPGASFSIKLTATKDDAGMDGFGWNINSSSSKASSGTSNTYTKSYTASTTEGTTTYTGYAWCYEGSTANYSSTYKTSNTIYVKVEEQKYTYTVTHGYGGDVSPTSGSVKAGSSVSIVATPSTGYTFAEWSGLTKATIDSTTSASTTLTPTANGATVKAYFRPNAPSALTLTGSNVVSGTNGTGTSSNPYIVFENSGFTLTANATVVSGATAHYSTTSNGTYSTTKTFSPSLSTKGVDQSYTVYAKAYTEGYYSTNNFSSTAHYMVFSHLNAANTGFSVSSNSITDADTLTLSGAYVNGVADAEKAYITQTYQVSTDNSTFSGITGSTWTPNTTGTYYFRVKTTNTKTGETVYSTSQSVTVTQSTVYYDITVTNKGSLSSTAVTLKTDGTTITNNEILSNSPLTLSISRTNTRYFEYITVDDGTTIWSVNNLNGNLTDELVLEHVKGDVTIEYSIAVKPYAQPKLPTNASSFSFKYYSEGLETTVSTTGTYYIDYGTNISYSVTPNTGFYVQSMSGVTMGAISASTATGTKNNVTANVGAVTATLTANKTVTVNVDNTSSVTTGGSMTIDGSAVAFGTPKPLNYGATAEVVITPPENCYALVSGNNVSATISTDGKATFSVVLTGQNKTYTVKFVENPKIYMVQPQYGSVYVTDNLGNYYFNGDSVGYGTQLTVNVKPDHTSAVLSNVLVNNASIGTTDGSTFRIYQDSTATATITVDSKFTFNEDTQGTEYGTRRIFFTDNASWGDNNVSVHPSVTSGDTNLTSNSIVMTYKYTNDMNQRVYYADIPFSAKYVTFYNKSNTNQKTNQAAVPSENNAFWNNNGTLTEWKFVYSDYIAKDRVTSIQQGTTVKDEAATFEYACYYGDDILTARLVSGNSITYEFNKGTLYITPTDNTYSYSLVEVKSTVSTTVKYYLIRVESFEIVSFTGLQKIYSTNVFNNIQLDLIVKGGILNYYSKLFISDTNTAYPVDEVRYTASGFEEINSLEAYINSFLVEYAINSISGVKYFKVEASDSANHKATATLKTLFGTNNYNGERVIYFYNNSGSDISKFNVRACFMDNSNNNKTFVTMQRVGNTDYYRAVIPQNAQSKVNFYLSNKNTFSNNYDDFDGVDDSTEIYSYGTLGVGIPANNDGFDEIGNIVFEATAIGEGITGSFIDFDY